MDCNYTAHVYNKCRRPDRSPCGGSVTAGILENTITAVPVRGPAACELSITCHSVVYFVRAVCRKNGLSLPQNPDKRGTPVEETGNEWREILLPAVRSFQQGPPVLKRLADMLAMARAQKDLA